MNQFQTLLLISSCGATPGSWTHVNFPCYEDGTNCVGQKTFSDPSTHGRGLHSSTFQLNLSRF